MSKPQLLAEKCASCVFRPGNLMRLRSGRLTELVRQNLNAGTALICHQTLSYGEHAELGEAVCRGFFDSYGPQSNIIRIMERLCGFHEIPAPGGAA